MPLTTYTEVLSEQHPFWQAYRDGSRPTPPGRPLREVLAETGGRYEDTVDLPERVMVDLRNAAAAEPARVELAAAARSGRVWISLESFRGLALDTLVVYGVEIEPTSSSD